MTDYSQMTDEQLNKLVATRVMGWYADIAENEWGLRFYKYGISTVMDARGWQPCTDLNQSVMVAEKLGEEIYVERRVGADYWVMIGELPDRGDPACAKNASLPRALVIACLMAVEGEG